MNRNRLIAAGVVVAVLAALGGGYAYSQANAAVTVTTAKAATQSLSVTVDASGTIEALPSASVYAPASGILATVMATDGQSVLAGDTLATLDTTSLDAAVAQAQAALSAARSARTQLDGTGTSDKALAAKSAADQAITAAENALALAQANRDRADLKAPFDGTVVVMPGVTPGAVVTPGAAVFKVLNPSALVFTAQVDEADVGGIQPGQKATVTLDAYPAAGLTGSVTTVKPSAITTSTGGVAIPVLVTLDATDKRLMLGMSGDARIAVSDVSEAVTIPVEAVFNDGGGTYVYLVGSDSKATKTAVTVGATTDTLAQITSGVKAGDTVVTGPLTAVKDGAKVTVK